MKDLNCINCDTPNLVDNIAESFECGDCGEVNPGLLIDNNIENDYDMELCVQNEEIKTLEEVVADIAKTDLADSVDHLWLSKWRNETKEKASQALEKLKEIRKKK